MARRAAAEYANGRRLYLTTTHFHPEHAFGAQSFAGAATYLVNREQAADLAVKGPGYLGMFRGPGEPVARTGPGRSGSSPASAACARSTPHDQLPSEPGATYGPGGGPVALAGEPMALVVAGFRLQC